MNFEERVNNAITKTIAELLKLGEETAQISFNTHTMTYDGESVTVTSQQTAWNEGVISATGDGVLFQEYGTGVGAIHPDGGIYNFTPGSWSRTKGTGKFDRDGYWWWKGKYYKGVPPAMAMYQARKTIEQNAQKIFEEEFK